MPGERARAQRLSDARKRGKGNRRKRDAMFGISVAIYLFLAGAGSGAAVVAFCVDEAVLRRRGCVLSCLRHLVMPGLLLGFVLVALGSVFLLVDLGRPERLLNMFMYPGSNLMSFGVFSITVFLASSAGQLLMRVVFNPAISDILYHAVRWTCVLSAAAVACYTGLLLQSWGGVAFWSSCLLPILFIFSSFSCGIALLVGSDFFIRRKPSDGVALRLMANVDGVLLVVEAFVLAGYLLTMWYDSEIARTSVLFMMTGDFSEVFWVGVVFVGLVLPIVLDLLPRGVRGPIAVAFGSAAVLVGAFMMRWCILFAAFI